MWKEAVDVTLYCKSVTLIQVGLVWWPYHDSIVTRRSGHTKDFENGT